MDYTPEERQKLFNRAQQNELSRLDPSDFYTEFASTEGFLEESRRHYKDLMTVESQRHQLTAEEFAEGPYGAAHNMPKLGKQLPWLRDMRGPNTYTYENKNLHEGLPRLDPPNHLTHDDPDRDVETP